MVTVQRHLAGCRLFFSCQERNHFRTVVIPSQEIQNWVNAAVDTRQRPSDLVSKVDNVEEFTVKI